MDIPMVRFWCGKRVDDLDRDELLAAFKGLADQYDAMVRINEIDKRMQASFAEIGYVRADRRAV